MKELSLNILDITENSTKAGATIVNIDISETEEALTITVRDDGTGMKPDVLGSVSNPFYTTRTTRRVGMGIPLFRFAAEQTGGTLSLESRHIDEFPSDHGTVISAVFNKAHIDFTPLGDIVSTVTTLIQGHPDVDFLYRHVFGEKEVTLDTRELREVLGDVPLDTFEVVIWIRDNLTEQYEVFNKN